MKTYKSLDAARADRSRVQIMIDSGKVTGIAEMLIMGGHNIAHYGYCTYTIGMLRIPHIAKALRDAGVLNVRAIHDWRTPDEQAAKTVQDRAKREIEDNSVEVYLSARGWGDYSPVAPTLDMRLSDAELIAACRKALLSAYDVDQPNQSDTDIIKAILEARAKLERRKAPYVEPDYGPGYCYSCESYCHQDCGSYAPKLTSKIVVSRAQTAARETNYGVSDE